VDPYVCKEGSRVALVRCTVFAMTNEHTGLTGFARGVRFCTLENGICDPEVGVDIDGRFGLCARVDGCFIHGSIKRAKGCYLSHSHRGRWSWTADDPVG